MIAKAILGLGFLLAVTAAALFVPAGTLHMARAWGFLAVFGLTTLAITIDLAVHDPELLARRVAAGPVAERRGVQQVIQTFASLAFVGVFVLAGFDRRFSWSNVPLAVSIAGDVSVALGLGVVALVFRANSFTSATIEVDKAQKLVSTGPYGVVRHPMYAGALAMMIAVPFALGSWFALVAVLPLCAVIVARLLDEERVLERELAGYAEYRTRVRWRLVPRIW